MISIVSHRSKVSLMGYNMSYVTKPHGPGERALRSMRKSTAHAKEPGTREYSRGGAQA
jgi:hypothetical protein